MARHSPTPLISLSVNLGSWQNPTYNSLRHNLHHHLLHQHHTPFNIHPTQHRRAFVHSTRGSLLINAMRQSNQSAVLASLTHKRRLSDRAGRTRLGRSWRPSKAPLTWFLAARVTWPCQLGGFQRNAVQLATSDCTVGDRSWVTARTASLVLRRI